MKRSVLVAILALGGVSLTTGAVMAQQAPPQGPDIGAMASEIGVVEADLAACLGPRPEPGQRPEHPDPAAVAQCLTEAGHSVSAEVVAGALQAGGPPPRG